MRHLDWVMGWLRNRRCDADVDLSKVEPNPDFDGDAEGPSDGRRGLYTGCLHPRGCWSYCTGGYRYCLCCNKVRVRC